MESPSRRLPSFLLLLGVFCLGVAAERGAWFGQAGSTGPPFPSLREAHRLVGEHFVDRSRVGDDELERAALRGMIRALGDHGHTDWLAPEDARQSAEDRESRASGIGVRVALVGGHPTLLEVFPDSPALKGGLRRGDVVRAIDGADVPPSGLGWVTARLRGRAGSAVRVAVTRGDERLEPSLTRAAVRTIDVMAQRLPTDPPTGLLVLRQFHFGTAAETFAALEHLEKIPVAGLVLDLRGNMGGLKDQCVRVASLFLPPGTPVLIEQTAKDPAVTIKTVAMKRTWADLPMVVLVDAQSASSSEMLAGALRDHGRAKLVGTRTFGTGTVLRVYPLPDGSAVRLAIKTWRTPRGDLPWYRGLTPDVEALLPADGRLLVPEQGREWTAADLANSGDAQLLKALEVLRGR
jgi:carboxyl-terminal processing protease